MSPDLIRLTQICGSPLVDRSGETLGRVDDLVIRLSGGEYPDVRGLRARIGDRQVFVPISQVEALCPGRVRLAGDTVNLRRFERREGEVLLQHDILDRKVINIEAGRLLPVNDLALGKSNAGWRVVGIDVNSRPLIQRALRRPVTQPLEPARIVDWRRIEPFVGHIPTAKLRLPLQRLRRLHPAQLADLLESASRDESQEIITAVHGDLELEADVFEELDPEHQIGFLRNRSDEEAAAVLTSMAPDDAADLINDLPQERRAPLLARLPAAQQAKIRKLLAYHPGTAGGLMTPDYLAVDADTTVAEVIQRVKGTPFIVLAVYVTSADRRLLFSISLQTMLRHPPESRVGDAAGTSPVRLHPTADFTDVAILMADYNLTEAPVMDKADHLVGVISIDDVLEVLIPTEWRRRDEGSVGSRSPR